MLNAMYPTLMGELHCCCPALVVTDCCPDGVALRLTFTVSNSTCAALNGSVVCEYDPGVNYHRGTRTILGISVEFRVVCISSTVNLDIVSTEIGTNRVVSTFMCNPALMQDLGASISLSGSAATACGSGTATADLTVTEAA